MKVKTIKRTSLFVALFVSQTVASSPLPDLPVSSIDSEMHRAGETSEQVAALDALVNPELNNNIQVLTRLSYDANQLLKTTPMPSEEWLSALGQRMRNTKREALQYLMRYLLVRVDTQHFILEMNQPEAINPELMQAYQTAESALIEIEAIEQPTPSQIWQFKALSHSFWLTIAARRPVLGSDVKLAYQALGQQLIEHITPNNIYDRITELQVMLEFQKTSYDFELQVFEFQQQVIDSQKAYFMAYSNDFTSADTLEKLALTAQNNVKTIRKNGVMLEKSGIQSHLEHLTQVLEKRLTKDKEAFQQAFAVYQAALQAVIEFRLSIQPVSSSF